MDEDTFIDDVLQDAEDPQDAYTPSSAAQSPGEWKRPKHVDDADAGRRRHERTEQPLGASSSPAPHGKDIRSTSERHREGTHRHHRDERALPGPSHRSDSHRSGRRFEDRSARRHDDATRSPASRREEGHDRRRQHHAHAPYSRGREFPNGSTALLDPVDDADTHPQPPLAAEPGRRRPAVASTVQRNDRDAVRDGGRGHYGYGGYTGYNGQMRPPGREADPHFRNGAGDRRHPAPYTGSDRFDPDCPGIESEGGLGHPRRRLLPHDPELQAWDQQRDGRGVGRPDDRWEGGPPGDAPWARGRGRGDSGRGPAYSPALGEDYGPRRATPQYDRYDPYGGRGGGRGGGRMDQTSWPRMERSRMERSVFAGGKWKRDLFEQMNKPKEQGEVAAEGEDGGQDRADLKSAAVQ